MGKQRVIFNAVMEFVTNRIVEIFVIVPYGKGKLFSASATIKDTIREEGNTSNNHK